MACFTFWLIATTAFLRASSAYDYSSDYLLIVPVCENFDCGSGHVCVMQFFGPTCAVKNGLPCTSDDFCECGTGSGYKCPTAKVCNRKSDGIPEKSLCPNGIGCKLDLYCDRRQNEYKCLKIQGCAFCTGDSRCKDSYLYAKGCYCYKEKCIPNP